jgi:phosphatidate phosphatase APP1
MTHAPPPRDWRSALRQRLEHSVIAGDDLLDALRLRFNTRFDRNHPRHIAAYRGYADSRTVELTGRVLANRPLGGPMEEAGWWDNLLDTYRRFGSDEVPHAEVELKFRGERAVATTDHEGYYRVSMEVPPARNNALWSDAEASLADGTLAARQPVLQVLPEARIGIISDIDDTVLYSGITHWKTAAQLTFLGNARTRKPLPGVALLYQALQSGADGRGRNPLFYVSSSPWNLYDLLDDFMALNAIPHGPIFLRDLGTDAGKFIKSPGHGHKLEQARELIHRFPALRWVLLGDSGQADAELYAEAAGEFGERIAAIYIRDVDPDVDSPFDIAADAHIQRVAGTRVPMLRAADSLAMTRHAAGLGLIGEASLPAIEAEVQRDLARPTPGEAAAQAALEGTPRDPVG